MSDFVGNKKTGTSLLGPLEQKFIHWVMPRIPTWIHSYHLTVITIPISLAIIACSYLTKHVSNGWLWAFSALIALQWLTDGLDGSLGRARGEGLFRWGYYIDHLLDYIFLCSVIIGYAEILPPEFRLTHLFVLMIFGAFMVHSFLAVSAIDEFRIVHFGIGPTEIRLIFILINTLIIIFGQTHLAPALPYVLLISATGLTALVYNTSQRLWQIDKQALAEKNKNS